MSWFNIPGSSLPRAIRLAIIVCIAIATLTIGSVAPANAVEATPEPSVDKIKVGALLCLDWSCLEFGDRLDGFTIYAIDINTGDKFDSCITDVVSEFEGCWLEIPTGSKWTLTFNESQTPEGFIYHGSLIGVEGGAHGSITYIPFHPLVETEPGHMVVQAALCTDDTCDEFSKLLDEFTISAVNPSTDQVYSECLTDNAQQGLDHQCILDVPAKGQLELRWVANQVPAGYVSFGEPITSGDPAVTTLAFVPGGDSPATRAPVTALPVTGSEGPDDLNVPLFGAVMSVTVLLGAAFAAERKMHRQ